MSVSRFFRDNKETLLTIRNYIIAGVGLGIFALGQMDYADAQRHPDASSPTNIFNIPQSRYASDLLIMTAGLCAAGGAAAALVDKKKKPAVT